MILLQFDRMKEFVETMQPFIEKYRSEYHKNVFEIDSTVCYDEYELYKYLHNKGEIAEKFEFALHFSEFGHIIKH